jgi:hypothetical protein
MTRDLWNWFMIAMMVVVIVVDVQHLWNPLPDEESQWPYLLSLPIAVLVIVAKVYELRQAAARRGKTSASPK